MYKHVIAVFSDYKVYVNLINTPAGTFLNRHPYVINIIKEALLKNELKSDSLLIEQDMGRVIGNTDVIETKDSDSIYYARPAKKKFFARIAKNRAPSPSRKLTLVLNRDDNGNYEIKNTWIGPNIPPFPGEDKEAETSAVFWESHALAENARKIVTKSITKDCPYESQS